MKTKNEMFVLARLKYRADELTEIAAKAAEETRRAGDAYATFKGNADELKALNDKRNSLAVVQREAERLAYDAMLAHYYASRN